MNFKLITMSILLSAPMFASANMSCSILMDGFKADKKKSVYDLNSSEKEKYNKCLKDMKLLPNSFKAFEEASEAEARKRDEEYKKKERDVQADKKLAEIKKTREEYTFTAAELENIFNRPVYGYRFAARVHFADKIEGLHYKVDKLTDINELCKAIGKEHGIKNLKAKEAHIDREQGHAEIDRLNNKGVVIPDSFWTNYELFETSKRDIEKMKLGGSRAIKVLEFSEVTCIGNENKEDTFEDLNPKITLHTKVKDIKFEAKDDDYIITDNLEVGERRSRDTDLGDDDLRDIQRETTEDEVERILRMSSGRYETSREEKRVIIK